MFFDALVAPVAQRVGPVAAVTWSRDAGGRELIWLVDEAAAARLSPATLAR